MVLKGTFQFVLIPILSVLILYIIQVKCSSCNEQSEKWIYICQTESVEVKGGRGTANLVVKCKLCSREGNMGKIKRNPIVTNKINKSWNNLSVFTDIIADSVTSYNDTDDGKFKTVVKFDCRGMEPSDFSPRV